MRRGIQTVATAGLSIIAAAAMLAPAAAAPPRGVPDGLPDHGRGAHPAAGGLPAWSAARAGGPGSTVDVEVRGSDDAIAAAVRDAGGAVLGSGEGAIHARIDPAHADALADRPGVDAVGLAPPLTAATTSQGVATTGADAWHTGGTDGTGVDVAIVDLGFADYASKLGTELPAVVSTSFGACLSSTSTDHGTAVAEVVHDMAPGATLHLICIDDLFDIDQAADPVMAYLRNNDIEVANASFGTFTGSRGDGQGPVDQAIEQSRNDGTLWTVATGNAGLGHVAIGKGAARQVADFVDIADPDAYLVPVDVRPSTSTFDRFVSFQVPSGGTAKIEARWDAWPITREDYDLWVFDAPTVSSAAIPDSFGSTFYNQLDAPQPPIELAEVTNSTFSTKTYYLLVDSWQAVASPIDLFFTGAVGNVSFTTPARTIAEPGSSPGAFTVGAACHVNSALEPFSGQGPTTDGRVKPDIVGPDGNDSSVYGAGTDCQSGFLGTSSAAPHVAGAAALVLEVSPTLDPSEVQAILEERAVEAGATGKDNQWGWGRLALGAVDVPAPPAGDLFNGLNPSARLVDTRALNQPIGPGATRRLVVAGTNGVPADATAVVLNIAAVGPTRNGYLTAFPAGAARPTAASLNFVTGDVVANGVTVGLGVNGAFDLYNFSGSTHVVVDIAGWYGPTGTTGLESVAPIRAVDTRAGKPTRIAVPGGDFGGSDVLTVHLAGNPAIPEVPATASAVVLNVAVTTPTSRGFLTVWPTGLAKPTASNINYDEDETIANLVVAKIGDGGQVNLATNSGLTNAIVDIIGYFDTTGTGRFVALPTVFRITDTRFGNGVRKGPIGAATAIQIQGQGLFGVPYDASAIVVNLTAITPSALSGHLRAWGSGSLPTASSLNFTKGTIVGNGAIIGMGASPDLADLQFGIYNSAGATNVVADLAGYFISPPP